MSDTQFVLLDAAQMDGYIYQAMDFQENHRCLYEGDSKVVLGAVAPYLFELEFKSHFAEWVVERGAGKSWGVIVNSETDAEELYHHFRHFLIVHTEEGKELYFRYYDPRVLRTFLPTCDAEQLQEFFGPVESYIMEDEEGWMIRFSLEEGELFRTELKCDLSHFLSNSFNRENHLGTSQSSRETDKGGVRSKNRWRMSD